MIYIVPATLRSQYNNEGGQSRLLTRTSDAIKLRYPKTDVFVDSPVVRALYKDFHIEVQPVFEEADGSFTYPHTKAGGSWKTTKPTLEIAAMREFDAQKNNNMRRLCKMVRAWKNKHGVAMGGLLIDTLAHNFLKQTTVYDTLSYGNYDALMRDFFAYLKDELDKEFYGALGSGQRVNVKKKFQKRAKKAFDLCEAAIASAGQAGEHKKWRKIVGRAFPSPDVAVAKAAYVSESGNQALNTEQFIEDIRQVDIRYFLRIDCRVTQAGFQPDWLRNILLKNWRLSPKKDLEFTITESEAPAGSVYYWKVLNRGTEAVRRDCVRGQIESDAGQRQKSETTTFRGDHEVECYAVLNGVVVAKDLIHVPIQE